MKLKTKKFWVSVGEDDKRDALLYPTEPNWNPSSRYWEVPPGTPFDFRCVDVCRAAFERVMGFKVPAYPDLVEVDLAKKTLKVWTPVDDEYDDGEDHRLRLR